MSGPTPDEEPQTPEPHFEPLVQLKDVEVKTHEEDEKEIFKIRAKLYRYATESESPEWKERGVGEVRILKHKETAKFRLLMRRDKTHKVCANHFISSEMELKPNVGSDRAWVWSAPADFADEVAKAELLAIRFANAENALKFKEAFVDCQQQVSLSSEADEVTKKLETLTVEEKKDEKEDEKPSENGESKVKTGDSTEKESSKVEGESSVTPDDAEKNSDTKDDK